MLLTVFNWFTLPLFRPLRMSVLVLLLFSLEAINSNPKQWCPATTVRSINDFNRLQNCTIAAGYIRLVNIDFTANMLQQLQSTNIEEINDYLLVYHCYGIESLEILFPKLVLIRGNSLLFDQFALLISGNRDLRNIGLISLLHITQGSIRIVSNPILCFTTTINWNSIIANSSKYHITIKDNKPSNYCPFCINQSKQSNNDGMGNNNNNNNNTNNTSNCWSIGKPQKQLSKGFITKSQCPSDCQNVGCDEHGICCNHDCLTSCLAINCKHCKRFMLNGECVSECRKPYFIYRRRDCVLSSFCQLLGLRQYNGECLEKCPTKYQTVLQQPKGGYTCKINCTGNFIINTEYDLLGLNECTIIDGSITIELLEIKSQMIAYLENAFVNLRELTGYLKVTRSPQLLSLHFFRNLLTIRGNHLIDNKYALYVVDNYHIEEIWNPNQKVAILRGRVYFHLNARLCYEKILELESQLKESTKITITDASPNSNGERVICINTKRQLNATIEDYNSNAARIKLTPLSSEEKDMLIGYIYYYKIAPEQNVSIYDGRNGCGHDNWHMDISTSKNIRHVLRGLKPYTQYAYFVKTLTLLDYHNDMYALSKVQYFRTLPAKPGAPAKLYYHTTANSANEIVVNWWPPHNLNGLIKHYILHYEPIEDHNSNITKVKTNYISYPQARIESTNNNTNEICECYNVTDKPNWPIPIEENYYNREQLIYDEALSNLIYVPLPKENSEKKTEKKSILEASKAEENLLIYRKLMEEKALSEQDTGPYDFPIVKPKPICQTVNATIQYQKENACQQLEHYDGQEINAGSHSYTLSKLKPNTMYRISIRCCVQDLPNGCGPANTIWVSTVADVANESDTVFTSSAHYV